MDEEEKSEPGAAEEQASPKKKKPVVLSGGRKFVREKLQGKNFLVPSFVTVLGIFCGYLAIINAIGHKHAQATMWIALAILLDGLDGRVARRLNATSAFGREFDSLSDMVSFGVAPAVLTYCWAFSPAANEIGLIVGFLFVVCGATRLARFNITTSDDAKGSFSGLPIPGAAAAVASIVYCFPEPLTGIGAISFMLVYVSLMAVFMVTTFPFLSVKKVKLTQGNPRINLLVLALLLGLIWKFNHVMVLLLCNGYAWSGVLIYLGKRFFPKLYRQKEKYIGLKS